MREQSFNDIEHPEFLGGAAVLVDQTAMNDLLDRLQNGDPTQGWEGDPRLVLAFHKVDQRWELHRLEADNQYRMLARSKPGMAFPASIIQELVRMDTRRGFDPKAYVDQYNAKVEAEKDYDLSQRTREAAEVLAWALKKDTRTGAGL